MQWMNQPLSRNQIESILGQLRHVGLEEHLNENAGPVDLTVVRELVERLMRAADPESGEVITQGDLIQAMHKIRTEVRAQL